MTEGDKDAAELTETLNNLRYDSAGRTLCRGSNEFSSKLLEKTIALQEKLAPSSTFHEKQSVSDLQQAAVEVKGVVESLDDIQGYIVTKKQMKKSWDQGWKWIIEKPEKRAKGDQEGRETKSGAIDREEARTVRECVR